MIRHIKVVERTKPFPIAKVTIKVHMKCLHHYGILEHFYLVNKNIQLTHTLEQGNFVISGGRIYPSVRQSGPIQAAFY
jgi:hypothetical protein